MCLIPITWFNPFRTRSILILAELTFVLHYGNGKIPKYSIIIHIYRMPSILGIAMAIRKDFFDKIGGFDANMQPYSDYMIELSIRVCATDNIQNVLFYSTTEYKFFDFSFTI